MHDPFVLPGRTESGLLGLLMAALLHCAVWVALSPRQKAVYVHHEQTIQEPSSVVLYVQPVLTRLPDIPLGKSSTPHAPALASSLPSKQLQQLPKRKRDMETQGTYSTTFDAVPPNVTNVLSADTSPEHSPRMNIDELKALARRDTERQDRARSAHAAIQNSSDLSGDAEQKAIEQAWRPKCDNNYKPKVGSVEFSGLMKLPFILKEATSEKGCKW